MHIASEISDNWRDRMWRQIVWVFVQWLKFYADWLCVCFEQLQDDWTDTGTDGQDECMRLLEDTLNTHIDDLRAMTDSTLKKYIRSWWRLPSF